MVDYLHGVVDERGCQQRCQRKELALVRFITLQAQQGI